MTGWLIVKNWMYITILCIMLISKDYASDAYYHVAFVVRVGLRKTILISSSRWLLWTGIADPVLHFADEFQTTAGVAERSAFSVITGCVRIPLQSRRTFYTISPSLTAWCW